MQWYAQTLRTIQIYIKYLSLYIYIKIVNIYPSMSISNSLDCTFSTKHLNVFIQFKKNCRHDIE